MVAHVLVNILYFVLNAIILQRGNDIVGKKQNEKNLYDNMRHCGGH